MTGATLLLVDDDTLVLRAMARAFSGAGAAVVTADRSFGLLNKIADLRPAVVVLDLRMPGLDGASLVQLIRQDPAISDTRVLLHSGLAADVLAATAGACGADGWVTKEGGMAPVVAAVRRLLALGEAPARASDPPPRPTLRGMPAVRLQPSRLAEDDRS